MLDVSFFNKKKSGRPQSRCRACHKLYMKDHYAANKARYVALAREREAAYFVKCYEWLRGYFSSHPCVDCGETDPIVLEFDHRDGADKVDSVSNMISRQNSLQSIMTEVEKCDVRCANCHRRRTAVQCGYHWVAQPSTNVTSLRRMRQRKQQDHIQSNYLSVGRGG